MVRTTQQQVRNVRGLRPGDATVERYPLSAWVRGLRGVAEPSSATRDTQQPLDAYRCPGDDGPPDGAHCPDWIANTTQSSFDHSGRATPPICS